MKNVDTGTERCADFAARDYMSVETRQLILALAAERDSICERVAELQVCTKPVLARRHTGMRVSLSGALMARDTFVLSELHEHLQELARRYYAGDITVVDEFLQLYCLDSTRPEETAPDFDISVIAARAVRNGNGRVWEEEV